MLNHLAQGTELTEMKRIKVNPTLIIGVDRGPFVTCLSLSFILFWFSWFGFAIAAVGVGLCCVECCAIVTTSTKYSDNIIIPVFPLSNCLETKYGGYH